MRLWKVCRGLRAWHASQKQPGTRETLPGPARTNYEGQAGRGVQRQGERPEARPGIGFVHSRPWQDASLEAGEGANKLTKHAQATRCRMNDGSRLANLPARDTPRVSLRSPVWANRTPGSVRGAPGNRCPDLDNDLRFSHGHDCRSSPPRDEHGHHHPPRFHPSPMSGRLRS